MQKLLFKERVLPNWPSFLLGPLLGLGVFAVFLPLLGVLALLPAIVAAGIVIVVQVFGSPVTIITDTQLEVGRATIERKHLGTVETYTGDQKRRKLGPELSALAYLRIQGSAPFIVKIEITDKKDPAPYWIFSTRRGAEISELLG